ncbi:MAG: alanine dehydrogenase [Tannerella sp.]|jgi:alanine dehydrogenase|nr:alanine dehydrogenase [Tannerella sp.]
MIIGLPKEIKDNENRVALTPGGAGELVKRGHRLYVQHAAGENSGFPDAEYEAAGAWILPSIGDVYAKAEMIIKVKEPVKEEYPLVRRGQLLFTYFHFASEEHLLNAMLQSGATCIAYETVENREHQLPLLIPMSEVAGRMSIQEGARFLEKPQGGKGILLGGVPGVKPARVLVLGGGVVGYNAAVVAAGYGADVTIADTSLPRLRYLSEVLPANVNTLYSSPHHIEAELPGTDLVIGAVLIAGAKTPHLITREMLKLLRRGSVLVDVAIDQGGCFETSRPTTHTDPVYEIDGIIHYCVANIPGAVAQTSTLALTNATLSYATQLADRGWRAACEADPGLRKGVNVADGKVTHPAVAATFGLPCEAL